MQLPEYFPLVDLMRKDVVDQRFFAIVALYKTDSQHGGAGGAAMDNHTSLNSPTKENNAVRKSQSFAECKVLGHHNNYPLFLRSLLKPIQASILADYDVHKFYNFSQEELAIMQASHAGEKIHTELVESILKKAGLDETYLKCPAIKPLNPDVLRPGEDCKAIHNNCSAKHAMMLAVSKQLNLPLENYTDINHPLQKLIYDKICDLSEYKTPPQTWDGCTLPVWGVPFNNIAKAFFKLYNNKKYDFLKEAYKKNPYIIGGRDIDGFRQDTFFMQLNCDLISKTGAGGFLSIYNNKTNEFLLIKMAQDNNKVRFLLASKLLNSLGWIDYEADYNYYNQNNESVGEYRVCELF